MLTLCRTPWFRGSWFNSLKEEVFNHVYQFGSDDMTSDADFCALIWLCWSSELISIFIAIHSILAQLCICDPAIPWYFWFPPFQIEFTLLTTSRPHSDFTRFYLNGCGKDLRVYYDFSSSYFSLWLCHYPTLQNSKTQVCWQHMSSKDKHAIILKKESY